MKEENIPDVVLIRKSYDRAARAKNRNWKLKRLIEQDDTASVANAFAGFLEDIEEDPTLREKINIYRDPTKPVPTEDLDIPNAPTLAEMLDELHINKDQEMEEST